MKLHQLLVVILITCGMYIGERLAQAQFANGGVDGFMQDWSSMNQALAQAAEYNADMQKFLNDNSQTAQDILKANPTLNSTITSLKSVQVNIQQAQINGVSL